MARARLARVGGGLGWRGVIAGSAVAVAVGVAVTGATAGDAALAGPVGPAAATVRSAAMACGKAVGPFSVNGTRVLGASGKPFIS